MHNSLEIWFPLYFLHKDIFILKLSFFTLCFSFFHAMDTRRKSWISQRTAPDLKERDLSLSCITATAVNQTYAQLEF